MYSGCTNWSKNAYNYILLIFSTMTQLLYLVYPYRLQADFDEPSSTLIGAHGYCTQVRLYFLVVVVVVVLY